MPECVPDPPSPASGCEHPYPAPSPSATTRFASLLAPGQPLRFDDFAALALYHPQFGYYGRSPRPIGRCGDFFTSVAVGPAFADLLACRIHQWWLAAGSPQAWRLVEVGAHDGTLARDLSRAFARIPAMPAPEHSIIEPLAACRAVQASNLTDLPEGHRVRILASSAELAHSPRPGFVLGNEVLDALPFRLVTRRPDAWHEWFVVRRPDDSLVRVELPVEEPALLSFLATLTGEFPDGYTTEVRLDFVSFLAPLAALLTSGRVLFLDYGFARPEFYDPARTSGTLRTWSRHQPGEDPLATPGIADLTAHVDFTAAAEAGAALGLAIADFSPQGSYLTRHCHAWLDSLAALPASARAAAIRQFHTLTHPAHLGARFHALELACGESPDAACAATARTRLALTPPR